MQQKHTDSQSNQTPSQNSTQDVEAFGKLHSQDARVSNVIYSAFLAIHMTAPLNLGNRSVGKRLVSTLFDSGANIFGMDRRIVSISVYTGKCIHSRTFSGRVEVFPQCGLHISTPW